MEAHAARVVLIGPEASGKTTLARELAERFRAPWTPEAARLFAESSMEPLSLATVGPIARLSMSLEDAALEALASAGERTEGPALLIRDTDLVSTVVYSRHYYGTVERWIEDAALDRRAELYLLCHPDLPWSPDGVRDRPLNREELFVLFREELVRLRATVVEIEGQGAPRRLAATRAVEALLAEAG